MGSSIIKSVLVAVLLVLLSFSIGVSAAEDAKTSVLIIGAICGIVAMLCIGVKSWLLLIVIPILICYTPVSLPFLPAQTASYVTAIMVLVYWGTLRVQKRVRFVWRSVPSWDVVFFILVGLMLYAFYRCPVSINLLQGILGIRVEMVGGTAYYNMVLAIGAYIAYSVIPVSLKELEKWQKWILRIVWVLLIVSVVMSVLMGAGSSMQESRVTNYQSVSIFLLLYVYGTQAVSRILTSVRSLFLLLAGCFGLAITGFRSAIAHAMVMLFVVAWVKREIIYFVVAGILGCGIVMVASEAGVLLGLPHGVQRVLSVFPGIKIDEGIALGAKGSSEVRYEAWEMAMDERTRLINDYVWGDGFGMPAAHHERLKYYNSRLSDEALDMKQVLVDTRNWHSGPISMIHELGYIGLGMAALFFSVGGYIAFVVMKSYRHHKLWPLVVIIVPHLYGEIYRSFFVCREFESLFADSAAWYFLIKVFYCEGVKNGIIVPLSRRVSYVPLTVQERRETEADMPEYPLPRKLKVLQNKKA